jgi:hypothetical protein
MQNENETNTERERIANDGLFGFEEWWAANKVKMEPPVMEAAFRELSLKSWNAALTAADYAICHKRAMREISAPCEEHGGAMADCPRWQNGCCDC